MPDRPVNAALMQLREIIDHLRCHQLPDEQLLQLFLDDRNRRAQAGGVPQGRVPRRGLSRAANAAERHPRLAADSQNYRRRRRTPQARARQPGAKRPLAGSRHRRSVGRVEDGHRQAPGKMDVVDLCAVLRRCGQRQADGDRQTLQLTLDLPPTPCLAERRPGRLQQVAWNLLSNAVKFTPQGGSIAIALSASGDDYVLSRTGPGIGITPEFLPFVFDHFRQADGSMTRQHGGLGLGLAIVKQVIELHNGSVTATSAGPGRGATFTVRLPQLVSVEPPDGRSRLPRQRGRRIDTSGRACGFSPSMTIRTASKSYGPPSRWPARRSRPRPRRAKPSRLGARAGRCAAVRSRDAGHGRISRSAIIRVGNGRFDR